MVCKGGLGNGQSKRFTNVDEMNNWLASLIHHSKIQRLILVLLKIRVTHLYAGVQAQHQKNIPLTLYSDTTLSAEFEETAIKVHVASNDTSMGKVSYRTVNWSENYTYANIAVSSITEVYHFVMWSDSNTDNPRKVTVTGDMEFTAVFEKEEIIDTPDATNETELAAVNIYTYQNVIAVENADAEIRIYDTMGHLATFSNNENAEIRINSSGVYIVKVGNISKRVMIDE